jgi:DNA-directed RNA polymerase subunit RPC12/RpoP
MSYLGKADCGTCGHEVDVRSNVSGKAYYRCGRCGFKAQQTEERGNRLFMATVRAETDPDAPETPGESPRIAEPAPAPRTAVKPAETKNKTAPAAPRGGLFGGVLRGA